MKNQLTSDSLPVWEQLLHRIGSVNVGTVRLPANLDIVELLISNESDQGRYFHRLVTALTTVLGAEVIAVVLTDSGRPSIISNLSKRADEALLKTRFIEKLDEAKGGTNHRLRTPVKLLGGALQYVSLSRLEPAQPSSATLLVLSRSILPPAERRLLRVVSRVLQWRSQIQRRHDRATSEQERLMSLINHLNEGLLILDRSLLVRSWNNSLQSLTGVTARRAIGQPYALALKRTDETGWLEEMVQQAAKSQDRLFQTEFEIECQPGGRRFVNASVSLLCNHENSLEQVVVVIRDISTIKELEQRKSEFISIATHELRTPITAIRGYLSLAQKDTANFTDKQRQYLARANEASERLVMLAEDLLRVVQLEEDRLQFNLKPLFLDQLLKKVTSDFGERARQKGLRLSLEKPSFKLKVLADGQRLEQVFANIIDNAIKYTTAGEVRVSLEKLAASRTAGERIAVRIKDTGVGIQARELEAIFDKFHRGFNSRRTRESGAGIGLYIVKSFIEKQGGRITVTSRTNRGSLFSVFFPVWQEPKKRRKKGE